MNENYNWYESMEILKNFKNKNYSNTEDDFSDTIENEEDFEYE